MERIYIKYLLVIFSMLYSYTSNAQKIKIIKKTDEFIAYKYKGNKRLLYYDKMDSYGAKINSISNGLNHSFIKYILILLNIENDNHLNYYPNYSTDYLDSIAINVHKDSLDIFKYFTPSMEQIKAIDSILLANKFIKEKSSKRSHRYYIYSLRKNGYNDIGLEYVRLSKKFFYKQLRGNNYEYWHKRRSYKRKAKYILNNPYMLYVYVIYDIC